MTDLAEIIHEQPDEATIEARLAAGYETVSLADGRLAWVHESGIPEMTDEDAAKIAADLYDEEFQQKMAEKFFGKW